MYTIASSFGVIFCHATSSNVEETSKAYDFHYFCSNILNIHNHKLKMATEKT